MIRTSSLAFAAVAVATLTLASACSMDGDDEAASAANGKSGAIPSGNPNGANDGAGCAKAFDCKSGVCVASVCAIASTSDGVRNGDETGLDCGGSAKPCAAGDACNGGGDCVSGDCQANKCTDGPPASAEDGKKNGDESDVDCGGKSTNAPGCADGKSCKDNDDCASSVCNDTKTCAVPSADDNAKNGDESDVDCGGTSTGASKCAFGKKCTKHEDCASDGCDDQKKCAVGRSCTQSNGGRTCGAGEVGDQKAKHESCCVALPIPGDNTTLLDKYEVTAGRMRAFITRVNGDVRGWYAANKGKLADDAASGQIDPYEDQLPGDVDEANTHLGGAVFLEDRPSNAQGCFTGNASNPAYGAHTYFTGTVKNATGDDEDRGFDQAMLDRLPLNCVTYPMIAAFCAWDGGRLQTWDENSAAYGDATQPWGDDPATCGFDPNTGQTQIAGALTNPPNQSSPAPAGGCSTEQMNFGNVYQFPAGGNPAKEWDLAYLIAAPGRFTGDVGPGGHMDLGGNLLELTASDAVGPGEVTDPKYGAKIRWSRSGSWEGHQANNFGWQFAIMTKYGKTGGRCARHR